MMRLFHFGFAFLCLLKAVDIGRRLPVRVDSELLAYVVAALWIVGSVALVTRRRRTGAAIVAVAGTAAIGLGLYNHHLYLMVVIGLILWLFQEDRQPMLLRLQLTVVYVFAALAKVNGVYLSGVPLERALGRSWFLSGIEFAAWMLVAASVASIVIEGGVAVGLWFDRSKRLAAAVGSVFHGAMVAGMAYAVLGTIRLAVYSGVVVLMYLAFFTEEEISGGVAWARRRTPFMAIRSTASG